MPLWTTILIGILASSVLATIAGKLLDIWLYKIKHKDDSEAAEDADVKADVKAIRAQVNELGKNVSTLNGRFDAMEARRGEDNAMLWRHRILRFGDELRHGDLHSQEHFIQIMADIKKYETYCKTHQDFKNKCTTTTTAIIDAAYRKCQEENKFLEYEIDATREEDIKADIKVIRKQVEAICTNSLSETYIAIRQTALAYIKCGKVSVSNKQQLHERYTNYMLLPGASDSLKCVIDAVDSTCRTVPDDDILNSVS